jgi:hypothetical protein
MISKDTIATAAHCLYSKSQGRMLSATELKAMILIPGASVIHPSGMIHSPCGIHKIAAAVIYGGYQASGGVRGDLDMGAIRVTKDSSNLGSCTGVLTLHEPLVRQGYHSAVCEHPRVPWDSPQRRVAILKLVVYRSGDVLWRGQEPIHVP